MAAALAAVALCAAACSSGSAGSSGSTGQTPDTKLKEAGVTLRSQLAAYRQATQHCAEKPNPIVCIEAADRNLGGQVHTYANLLAVGRGFRAPDGDLSSARNSAQTLANSLEILGDAQPTQANYDHVLNTFDLNGAIDQLQTTVSTLNRHLAG